MKRFRLATRPDWLRIRDYVKDLLKRREDGTQITYRVTVEELADPKTEAQNDAQHAWYADAAKQLGDNTAEWYRGYCKLHFGVPILRSASPEYRAAYDSIIRPLPYEQKIAMMMAPLDFPVTRAMTKRQLSEYLDAVYQHLRGLGVNLDREAA